MRLVFIVLSCRRLLKPNAVERVPRRHVRQDHLVAGVQARDHFDRVDRAAAELDLHARGARRRLSSLNRPTALCSWPNAGRPTNSTSVSRSSSIVPSTLRSGTRALRQLAVERDVDGHGAVLHRRIDAR